MILLVVSLAALAAAALPTALFLVNLPRFEDPGTRHEPEPTTSSIPPDDESFELPPVSLLIPARDEAAGIEATVRGALRSRGVSLEVVVLDDHSSDETASIVQRIAEEDPRVRCVAGRPLPAGWNGKQFACWQLSQAARHQWLAFLDADVRLAPDGLRALCEYRHANDADLLSAFPHQQTGTWLEKWLIPMMHLILLGFLPLHRMRTSRHEAYAAGCGQWFLTSQDAYTTAGTHEAIRGSRHDGVKLPRAYRAAGLSTDLVDGTSLASCRMYRSGREVIRGVLKNATEGIANPRLIVPFSVILLGGSLLPWLTLAAALLQPAPLAAGVSLIAIVVSYLPRMVAVARFRQSPFGAICHPLATTLFVALQWLALIQHVAGRQVAWRGRVETAAPSVTGPVPRPPTPQQPTSHGEGGEA